MVSYIEPEFLNSGTEEDRLKSFSFYEWPNPLMSPVILASAGFSYLGYRDRVYCNKCPITVEDWDGNEDPWFVHIKANPFCHFLLEAKGVVYIQDNFNLPIPPSLCWDHSCCGLTTSLSPNAYYHLPDEHEGIQCICKVKAYLTSSVCINCKRNYPRSCLLPCGHTASCKYCSPKLKVCSVCKGPISFRLNEDLKR